eukprot:NODE_318_length_11118_cov_0.235049.p6 type:complete len:164 gc:universal NODE_318_length_11118_cov_0.235049:1419-1910(+)
MLCFKILTNWDCPMFLFSLFICENRNPFIMTTATDSSTIIVGIVSANFVFPLISTISVQLDIISLVNNLLFNSNGLTTIIALDLFSFIFAASFIGVFFSSSFLVVMTIPGPFTPRALFISESILILTIFFDSSWRLGIESTAVFELGSEFSIISKISCTDLSE